MVSRNRASSGYGYVCLPRLYSAPKIPPSEIDRPFGRSAGGDAYHKHAEISTYFSGPCATSAQKSGHPPKKRGSSPTIPIILLDSLGSYLALALLQHSYYGIGP